MHGHPGQVGRRVRMPGQRFVDSSGDFLRRRRGAVHERVAVEMGALERVENLADLRVHGQKIDQQAVSIEARPVTFTSVYLLGAPTGGDATSSISVTLALPGKSVTVSAKR